jgi:hypothetical protein
MCHGNPPPNRDTITLGHNVFNLHVKIRKGANEVAVDSLERLRPQKNRVRFRKAMGLAVLVEHFVDRCFILLVPNLLKPAL